MVDKKILLIIFFVIFMCSGLAIFVDYHENAHKAVFRNYGINSTINYFDLKHLNFWDLTATTTPIGNYTCDSWCISNQNHVEIQGYHTIALILNLWIIFALFIMYIKK